MDKTKKKLPNHIVIRHTIKQIGSQSKFCNLLNAAGYKITPQALNLWSKKERIPCKYRLPLNDIIEEYDKKGQLSHASEFLLCIAGRHKRKGQDPIEMPISSFSRYIGSNKPAEVTKEINNWLSVEESVTLQLVYQWLKQGYVPKSWCEKLPLSPECFGPSIKSEENKEEDLLA